MYIEKALLTLPENERLVEASRVALIFGFVTMMSGIIGVPMGMYLSTKLKVSGYDEPGGSHLWLCHHDEWDHWGPPGHVPLHQAQGALVLLL